jgi:hypothetical protein
MSLRRKDILASAVALLLVLLMAAVVSNWSPLTSAITTSIIRNDLADHASAVPHSPLPDKLRLLDHLDALEARSRSSPPVSLSRCRQFDAAMVVQIHPAR